MRLREMLLLSLLPFATAWGGGKHLEIMAPLSRQHDFHGMPHKVIEREYHASVGDQPQIQSTKHSEYDSEGNGLRIEKFDASNKKTGSEVYRYDAEGTLVAIMEQDEESPAKDCRIFLNLPSRQVAHVDQAAKKTEFYTYSEEGFELGTYIKSSTGKILEKTTIGRNAANKEETLVFEEPAGTRTTEIFIEWSGQGFQSKTTMIMHDKGGSKFVTTYDYPEVDPAGNWLIQIAKTIVYEPDGSSVSLSTETNKRTITYHSDP